MSLVTLADVLQPALRQGYAVAGLVALGWEDMRAYVAAAEAEGFDPAEEWVKAEILQIFASGSPMAPVTSVVRR